MTTDMHKAPSVARKALNSPGSATPVARYDLSTSEGGRRFIAEFFATELRRHDFTNYISTRLAADFACALAQHLAATGKHQAGEVHGDAHVVVLREMRARLTGAGSPARTAALDAAIAALAARQPGAQVPFGWWLEDANGVGYFSRKMQPAALYAHRTTPGYSATPLHAAPPAQGIDLSPGIEAAAKLIQKKADDYAEEFGYDDMGGLSFGRGHHAEVKSDHHCFMMELVDELRALIDQRDAAPGVAS